MEALRTPEITKEMLDTTSEDEDESPIEGFNASPGKRKAQQVKDKKQAKRRVVKNKHDDDVIELLRGMVSTMNSSYKKDRMTAAAAGDKNRWKDVSKKITQITAQNGKNLKVVAQLYQKAEGEG